MSLVMPTPTSPRVRRRDSPSCPCEPGPPPLSPLCSFSRWWKMLAQCGCRTPLKCHSSAGGQRTPPKKDNKDWRMISAGEVVHEDTSIKAGTKSVQVNDTRSQWSERNEDPAKCKYKHQCSKLNHLGGSHVGQISTNIYKYLVHKIHHYFDALNTSLMYIKLVSVFCNPILSNKIARFNLLYCVKVKETANVSKNP